jgi:2-polyprenyl-3-methyl-5-hydroxy-6-metoxy-1,4-benzoquinol methylase
MEFFRRARVETLDIDPHADATYTADLCRDNSDCIAGNTFDLVICTEVLEHTLKPWLAVDELHRMLRPGGCLALTSPFNFRIHGPEPDCWRFTESGLRSLLDRFARVTVQEAPDATRPRMPVHYRVVAYKGI